MDFTISGQVGRSLFVTDTDSGTKGEIKDSNGATRARANGSTELEDGSTIGIQFEYALDDTANIRHANIQFTNPVAGRITLGQGSEAGDGSAGLGPGVSGIGAGQVTNLSAHFNSLDGGGRINMVRYDTPAIGPVSAAMSVGNEDNVSGLVKLSSEFSGTSFGAQVGTLQEKGKKSTLSASFGVTLPSGLSVGGGWGKGNDHGAADATPDTVDLYEGEADGDCPITVKASQTCGESRTTPGLFGVTTPGKDAVAPTDPSYFRLGIGYTFGGTTVAASWYNSENFVVEDSDGTAIGIGVSHTIPKAGATIHASVQQYDVKGLSGPDLEETVFQLGTLVTF